MTSRSSDFLTLPIMPMASFFWSYSTAKELLFFLYLFNLNKVEKTKEKVPAFMIWKSVSLFPGGWKLNLSKGKRHLSEGYIYFIFCVHWIKFSRLSVDSEMWDSIHYRDVQGLPVQKEIIAIYALDSTHEKFVVLKRSLDSRNSPCTCRPLDSKLEMSGLNQF